jgi:uncharacterized protein (TIGR02646 family)
VIRIRKGAAPSRLISVGGAATVNLKKDYDAAPNDFRNGTRKLKFNDSIFRHNSVRDKLIASQHGKCCYCEVKIPVPYALQHVEHYRPKSRSRQSRTAAPVIPGYYWLAYEWTNLFLCCGFCNSSNKGDQFPLANEALRARDHHDRISRESPLILCPSGPDDPEPHIEFHEEIPKGITPEGRTTIQCLGLDSPKHEPRLDALGRLRKLRNEIIVLKTSSGAGLRKMIRERRAALVIAKRASSPYCAMARQFLDKNPIP